MGETYLIEKGQHYSNFNWSKLWTFTFSREIKGTVEFVGDFSYESNGDTNKLIGLSDGWNHHKNSVRIGWRWNKGIQIMAIYYVNGLREIHRVMSKAQEGVKYNFRIVITKSKYHVLFNGYQDSIERKSKWFLLRYKLFPYFGGTETAPKEFKFKINICS